jgi:hypothetical protein
LLPEQGVETFGYIILININFNLPFTADSEYTFENRCLKIVDDVALQNVCN